MTSPRGFDLALDLPTPVAWSSIDVATKSIRQKLAEAFTAEECQTIAMVARELLENAAKYRDDAEQTVGVRLRIWVAASDLSVLVENRVKPDDDRVRQLLAILAWMKQFDDPAEAFRAKLVGERPPEGGGLGIVRIAHEGNCGITADLVDSTLRVTAHIPISLGPRLEGDTMESLVSGDLRIDVTEDGDHIMLVWKGNSTAENPTQTVIPYLRGVLNAATSKSTAVEMNFLSLEYFNSATISVLIQLIQEARSRSVKLVLVYDAAVKWQRLNFEALSVFAKGDDLLTFRHN